MLVERLLDLGARDAGIGLRVGVRDLDRAAENAAFGVDLGDGEIDAVLEVRADGRAAARQLADIGDLDRPPGLGERNAAKARGESNSTRDLSMPSSQMSSRWRLARTVSGSLAAPLPPFRRVMSFCSA